MKPSLKELRARKGGERLALVTAYDAPGARQAELAGIDAVLVGDSLGMVVLGYSSTTQVTLAEMLHHLRAVCRGAQDTFVIADVPFGYLQRGKRALASACVELIQAGADAVKSEGGLEAAAAVRWLVERGVPVVGHLGLTPQTATALGGYHAQGRDLASARRIFEAALALDAAGAFALVLEAVPATLAARIRQRCQALTIGIGAGADCDGQILVYHDLLGIFDRFTPKFVRRYAELGEEAVAALRRYREEVRGGGFPTPAHSFSAPPSLLDELE